MSPTHAVATHRRRAIGARQSSVRARVSTVYPYSPGRPAVAAVALRDAAELLALVWSVPLAVLLVGAPIALAMAFLLWLVRLVWGAV